MIKLSINRIFSLVLLALIGLSLGVHLPAQAVYAQGPIGRESLGAIVVVANRASGSVSVIDVATDLVVDTIDLPGDMQAEPMYVVYSVIGHRVFVGDRANSQVVVFRAWDMSVEKEIPVDDGVFHMWASAHSGQLWVNCDIDNTSTVIDLWSLKVIDSVPMPEDLVEMEGIPHDVILDPVEPYAYVTMLGFVGDNDYVIKFSTETLEEVDRAAVGKDPHLSLTLRNDLLYLPCQGSDAVFVLERDTLDLVKEIEVPAAHGAGMTLSGRVFYTTNIMSDGTDGLYAISTHTNKVINDPVDTPYPVPHNIVLTPSGLKLFLTHSGAAADQVTIYTTSWYDPIPEYSAEVTVGSNPFGLGYVPFSSLGTGHGEGPWW